MALDIYISGCGFGETIVLKWTDGPIERAAMIDCYAAHNGLALFDWLEHLGVNHLSFLAVTHPHVDHVYNVHRLLRHFERNIDQIWWWGGIEKSSYIAYFKMLARRFPNSPNSLGRRANAVLWFLTEAEEQLANNGIPICSSSEGVRVIYPSGRQTDGSIAITAFSPWLINSRHLINEVSEGIRNMGDLKDTHHTANCASMGFLVNYGRSEIVLGGDVEDGNWTAFSKHARFRAMTPCVVKVSHHGSQNGRITGMWNNGFFDSGMPRPIAVITPWKTRLPDASVINEIRKSGCDVYVTGTRKNKSTEVNSYIQLRVHRNGEREVVHTSRSVTHYPGFD